MSRKLLFITSALALALSCITLAACSKSRGELHDGTYTAQSMVWEDDDDGNGSGYGVITLTIENGEISAAEFLTYEPDGTLKDENYGKSNDSVINQDFYNKAQRAVAASEEYAKQLVELGDPDKVDVISGATISYGEFQEAANTALDEAAQ